MLPSDKGKPDQSQGRKATGPRLLRDAFCDATKDPKIAGLQVIPDLHRESSFARSPEMTRRLKLGLGAVLIVLPFMSTTSYADEMPVSMQWAGTVTDTAINVLPDDFVANLIDAQAQGSFGATSVGVLTEFVFGGFCDVDVLHLLIGYSRPITTFANGDQLWGDLTSGWMCINVATGDFEGFAEGVYEGGTGRFAGATGSFTVDFRGKNLTISDFGVGFGAIHGEIDGTLVLQ